MGQRSRSKVADELVATLTPPLTGLGLDLEAVEVSQAGKRSVLRVAVDKDGGVTLDDVAEATRTINDVLDDSDVMGESPYTLEVTSRGVDRPLTLIRHWRRNVGRLVKVTLTAPGVVTGRVVAVTEDEIILDIDGTETAVPFDDIVKALVQIEFNRRGPSASDEDTDSDDTDSDDTDTDNDTDETEEG